MKKFFKKPFMVLATVFLALSILPGTGFAASNEVVAEPHIDPTAAQDLTIQTQSPIVTDESGNAVQALATDVAILTLWSVPSGSSTGSSGGDGSSSFGTHSFITVKNISASSITIGKLSGIAANKLVSVGTWGNKTEHTGIWYNLEAMFINNYSAYSGRVSHSMYISSTQLSSVNSYIINHDSWSLTNNCSSFAVGLWNSISSDDYSAGTINTPQNLYYSIKDGAYNTNAYVPYDYAVYYAQGTGTPIRSTQF
ncbi:hypothetical protein [Paenibacillus graminis]|uniref:hypothetical protein n=1 Tax=Paenibacillus graminis TaxID=189425 RepID=UPI00047035E7|nr:hypothetical protein [Paenibacillus graminis]